MDDIERYFKQCFVIRQETEKLCKPLVVEDYLIQTMPDVSPIKWHLGHTAWFYERFLLIPFLKNYRVFSPHYHYLYNSYYHALGDIFPREKRGIISRPGVEETYNYRAYVDQNLGLLQQQIKSQAIPELLLCLKVGNNHEQQHQELMLMDLKYNFAHNPLRPAYNKKNSSAFYKIKQKNDYYYFAAGVYSIGDAAVDFAFDNERPRHEIFLSAFKIARHLVSNAEYLAFMEAGGYEDSKHWLSDGWMRVQKEQWQAPLYWEKINNEWWVMTLQGMQKINWDEPVCHVSYYEADAYARWAQARLPTEAEWEVAAQQLPISGNFLENGILHPQVREKEATQFFGDVWEWTQSAYLNYPGFVPYSPPLTEYNAKFACNQFVLRGGSAITPKSHIRASYRNFYYPHQRWVFSGIRLGGGV